MNSNRYFKIFINDYDTDDCYQELRVGNDLVFAAQFKARG